MTTLRGEFYIWCRTPQGSRAAPLTFAVIAGIAAGFVQSIVANLKLSGLAREEARMQMYVDDPLVGLRRAAA